MVYYLFSCPASNNTFNRSFISCYVLNYLSIPHMSILENVFLYLPDRHETDGDVVSDVAKLILYITGHVMFANVASSYFIQFSRKASCFCCS